MDILKIINDWYDEKTREQVYFRNGPLGARAIKDLQQHGAAASVSSTENGVVVTEYFASPTDEEPFLITRSDE